MSRERAARAPAKVNLGLRVLGRRPDGYHEIESLFAPLDLADEIRVAVQPDARGRVTLSLGPRDARVPDDATNLAVRAAAAFLDAAEIGARVHIELAKRIPAAAGLGGGSSDAGTVLRELAARFPDALPGPELQRVALELGADVPFFLDPRPARVGGIGECRTPVKGIPRLDLLLLNPGEALPTAEVYRAFDALRQEASGEPHPLPETFPSDLREAASRGELARLLRNDLEIAATRLCPPIRRLRARLIELGALAVGMSGSGATLYGVFETAQAARAALDRAAPGALGWARVASTLECG